MSPAAREATRIELDRVKTPEDALARKLLRRSRARRGHSTVRLDGLTLDRLVTDFLRAVRQ